MNKFFKHKHGLFPNIENFKSYYMVKHEDGNWSSSDLAGVTEAEDSRERQIENFYYDKHADTEWWVEVPEKDLDLSIIHSSLRPQEPRKLLTQQSFYFYNEVNEASENGEDFMVIGIGETTMLVARYGKDIYSAAYDNEGELVLVSPLDESEGSWREQVIQSTAWIAEFLGENPQIQIYLNLNKRQQNTTKYEY